MVWQYASYTVRVGVELERAARGRFGGRGAGIARAMLVSAAHTGALDVLRRLIRSPRWTSGEPGLVDLAIAVRALGWGRWSVVRHDPRLTVFVVRDDPELAWRATLDADVSSCAPRLEGVAAALVDAAGSGDRFEARAVPVHGATWIEVRRG